MRTYCCPATRASDEVADIADAVILLASLIVAEHFVGLVDLLEPGLGLVVVGVLVRVVFLRELAVRLLEVALGCSLGTPRTW